MHHGLVFWTIGPKKYPPQSVTSKPLECHFAEPMKLLHAAALETRRTWSDAPREGSPEPPKCPGRRSEAATRRDSAIPKSCEHDPQVATSSTLQTSPRLAPRS